MREPDNELGLSWLPLFDFFGEIFENHGYMPKLFSGIFFENHGYESEEPVVFTSEPAMDWQLYVWLVI